MNYKTNMPTQNTNITQKVYKKLSIQVSLNGFSFCCFDTMNATVTSCKEVRFNSSEKNKKIEDVFTDAFLKYPELKEPYDTVLVIHTNTLCTFVPEALFDENFLGNYLQYNTKVFETDFFAFDAIAHYQINAVYIPYVNINNFFIDQFGSFDYKHANSILVNKLLIASKNKEEKKMFIQINLDHFEIIVIENQKLLFFNSFEYNTPEDFIYYTLFTAEQLNLNPEKFKVEFIGRITVESDYYKIAYQYIRNVSLLDVTDLQWNNYFSETENRNHFILLNS